MAKLEVDAPWVSVDPVGEALHLLRMTGIFYCRTEVSAPWSLEMPPFGDCLSVHVVTSGGCWLRVGDAPPLQLSAGDLALVPHGRGHLLMSSPQTGQAGKAGRVDLLPQEHLNAHYSILRHGGGGETSTLVCAVVSFDGPAAHQLVRLLPPVIHATGSDPRTSGWIGATLALLTSEVADLRPGGEAVTTRLADILVIQAIRSWIDSDDPRARAGWLGALSDPLIGRAIAAIHRELSRTWTVASLARVAAMSRSSFAARFTRLVGEPALQYVTRWRMHVALARLEQGQTTVRELAGQSGYGSEAAFSRAFKRMIGVAPGSVRGSRDPSAGPH